MLGARVESEVEAWFVARHVDDDDVANLESRWIVEVFNRRLEVRRCAVACKERQGSGSKWVHLELGAYGSPPRCKHGPAGDISIFRRIWLST